MEKFPNIIEENFLTDDELNTVEEFIMNNTTPWDNYTEGKEVEYLSSRYYVFNFYDPKFKAVYDILAPKIQKLLGDLYIGEIHIFDSIDPYNIHTDVCSGIPVDPAWTLIIPLDDYESHTIVFNEGQNRKSLQTYCDENPPHENPPIDDKTYEKYFSHCTRESLDWLSIGDVFKWKRGSIFATDRWKFHTSDNYLKNGITNKRAIIAWTNTKKPDPWNPKWFTAEYNYEDIEN